MSASSRAAATAAANAASQGGAMNLLDQKRIFYKRFNYVIAETPEAKCSLEGELMIEVETDEVKRGFFSTSKKTKLVPLMEGLKKNLPEGSKILNLVIDWHNDRVRVWYSKPD